MTRTETLLTGFYRRWRRVPRYPAALLLAAALMSTSGCTHRAWYEGVKQGHSSECSQVPESEREDCLAQHDDSFEEYQRKRGEVVE